jgi:hypothetical protein
VFIKQLEPRGKKGARNISQFSFFGKIFALLYFNFTWFIPFSLEMKLLFVLSGGWWQAKGSVERLNNRIIIH